MPSYAVTGSSRGLGLGYVRTLSADPSNTVFAIIRSHASASELLDFVAHHSHKNIHVIEADNKDANALQRAADTVARTTGGTLDVLINNAALMAQERGGLTIDAFPDPETLENDLLLYFKTNTIGPIHTINAFLPLLRAGTTKKCLTISTTAGSPMVANKNNFDTFVGYGISKAALNLAIAKYASRFRDEGIIFIALTPGMVKTMPGTDEEVEALLAPLVAKFRKAYPHFEGPITVEQSVRDALAFLDRATVEDSGRFVSRDGRDGDNIY